MRVCVGEEFAVMFAHSLDNHTHKGEYTMSVGKRIYLKPHIPNPTLIEEFEKIPASKLADVMGKISAMNPSIHLVSNPKPR